MAGPEVRMGQGTVLAIIAIVVLGFVGFNAGWFSGSTAPTGTGGTTPTTPSTLTVVPAIEKTNIYVSGYDQADFDGEKQKNRVAGTADLIKSGNVLETITLSASTGVASSAELNGGDMVTVLADATSYYANAVEAVKISETLQPVEVMIKAASAADTSVLDDQRDELAPYEITLDTNDVSKTHYIKIERPGDDTWYQFCGIAADFDDDVVDVRVKDKTGSFVEGVKDLSNDYDNLDDLGNDVVWAYDSQIKNFDELEIAFVVGTAKDVNPSASVVGFTVFDCEHNLQNGKIVYTNEDASDADVGLANIVMNVTIQ